MCANPFSKTHVFAYSFSLKAFQEKACRLGEIGKHNRLKICIPFGITGSSPVDDICFKQRF